jgi:hypothetical protein
MRTSRAGFFTHNALLIALAVAFFVAGVATAAWFVERERAECWREVAEEGVSAVGRCDR